MNLQNILLTFGASILMGLVCGSVFAFTANESGVEKNKQLFIAVFWALGGWLFGIILPLIMNKVLGVLGISLGTSIVGSYIYMAAIKKKTRIMKRLDSHLR